ncbi:TraR/DksA family transcriptional regulator [Streptomyces sp. NPDC058374]
MEDLRLRAAAADEAARSLADGCDLDAADAGSRRAAVADERRRADEAREQLGRVQAARCRLDDGTFGRCVSCGTFIDPERMSAVPYTELCVSCSRGAEGGGR